jgi:hypothetical protein
MSGTTLEALSFEYALTRPEPETPRRRAQKLCTPCCHIISQNPTKYCDAVSLSGETYCAAHSKSVATGTTKPATLWFNLLTRNRVTWRTREA